MATATSLACLAAVESSPALVAKKAASPSISISSRSGAASITASSRRWMFAWACAAPIRCRVMYFVKPPMSAISKRARDSAIERNHGFQQADDQEPGGGRRRAGARAPVRQPRALPRAPAARAPRPGAATGARARSRRTARRDRGEARREAADGGDGAAARRLGGLLARARSRGGRDQEARGRVRLDRAPAARAGRRP